MRLCGKSALERVAPGTKGEFGGGRVGGGNDLWRDENRETQGIQGDHTSLALLIWNLN